MNPSPMNLPPMNPPPMPRFAQPTLAGAVRGPLLLITLGVLLAVDQMGGQSFWRTWPVLLIVYGVTKLIDFMGSR